MPIWSVLFYVGTKCLKEWPVFYRCWRNWIYFSADCMLGMDSVGPSHQQPGKSEEKTLQLGTIFTKVGWVVDIPARTDLHCCQHLLFPQHIQVHKSYTPIVVKFMLLMTGFCWQSWGPLTQTNQQISGHHPHILQSDSWNIAKLSQNPKVLQNHMV